jgi:transposase
VRERGLLDTAGRQRTDTTYVLAAIRVLNRLELVGETVRHALNSVAAVAPEWLGAQVPPAWFDRYASRIEKYRLPKPTAAREELPVMIGANGRRLLQAVDVAKDLPWLRETPAVQTLRQVWAEQYTDPPGPLRWRVVRERTPSAELIASPHDPEARYSVKRGVEWVGNKVHLTETCDSDSPHLIAHVMTTPATTPDCVMGPAIQQDLATHDLLPGTHLLDGGYVDAEFLVTAQTRHQINVVGPTFGSYLGRFEEIPLRLASIRGWAGGEFPPARRAWPLLHLLLLWSFESPVSLQVLDPPQECRLFRSPPRLPADTGAEPAAHSSSRLRCLAVPPGHAR